MAILATGSIFLIVFINLIIRNRLFKGQFND